MWWLNRNSITLGLVCWIGGVEVARSSRGMQKGSHVGSQGCPLLKRASEMLLLPTMWVAVSQTWCWAWSRNMCLRVTFVSLLWEPPLFVTVATPRLLEWTRYMDWEGSEHENRHRWMAMWRLSSIATALAQPMSKLSLGPMQSSVNISKSSTSSQLLCQYQRRYWHHPTTVDWWLGANLVAYDSADSGPDSRPRRGLSPRKGELVVLCVVIWKWTGTLWCSIERGRSGERCTIGALICCGVWLLHMTRMMCLVKSHGWAAW